MILFPPPHKIGAHESLLLPYSPAYALVAITERKLPTPKLDVAQVRSRKPRTRHPPLCRVGDSSTICPLLAFRRFALGIDLRMLPDTNNTSYTNDAIYVCARSESQTEGHDSFDADGKGIVNTRQVESWESSRLGL